jgi:Ribosomally synthesized peptide prototyped by Frankia Franean1_4349.
MSQRSVERVIGRLATDEAFRRRFALQPEDALRESMCCGLELTPCEIQALTRLDARSVERFAEAIDPRLQKTDIPGGLH